MARINPVDHESTQGPVRETLDRLKAKHGGLPNLIRTLGNSAVALQSYVGLGQAIGGGTLSAALREQIAVTMAGVNGCEYCASAHTMIGKKNGVDGDELARNLVGDSADDTTKAVLSFARVVTTKRGFVSDEDLTAIRDAGFDDGQVLEIVANVVHNTLTNYVNHVAQTTNDFPRVAVGEPVSA
ncbi:MAG: putative peroxidase-related enzyme [Phycisphaerales bacterium]|jgi:uncharacterized peroxidase-related enzyme